MSVLTSLGGYGSESSSDESDTEKEKEEVDTTRVEEKSLHLKVKVFELSNNLGNHLSFL